MTESRSKVGLDELKSLTVLYVEDEPDVRAQLKESLQRRVGRLWVAEDGQQGLALFREHRPQMVVTDILMPGMDGLDMAAGIRELDDSVPILVTTAFEQVDYLLRSIEIGVDRYITKPVDLAQLYVAMSKCARTLRSEQRLRESEERFRNALEYAPIGMAIVSPEGKWLKVNAALCETLGYSAAELERLTLQDITFPDDREADRVHLEKILRGEIGSYQIERHYLRKDGQTIWALLTVSLVRDEQGDPIHFVAQMLDITERKRLETELRQLNESLEKRVAEEVARNREQDLILNQQARLAATGQMIHNIAHQWKQPISALSIILSNLKDDFQFRELTPDALDDTLKQARRVLQNMTGTIDDFCNFFRPDRAATTFDVAQAVEDALAIMSATLKNHRIEVVRSLAPGLKAHGYPNQFAHAVLNLISNAKEVIDQRTPPNGRVEIRLGEENGMAQLTVQDNGGGIATDVLPKLFDPYFTTKAAGSGIGLYMTKMIIERNFNGTIEVRNQDDGALFTLSLPLWTEKPSP